MSLLHAEYLKVTRRKLYPLMSVILVMLTVLTGFFLLYFAQIFEDLGDDFPTFGRAEAFVVGAQQIAGQTWFPMIFSVVLLGGEFATTVWATSLTRDARKRVQIGARVVVVTLASWLAMLLAMAIWVVLALGMEGGGSLQLGDWVGIIWKLGLVQLPWVALGMGLVAVMRSVGPAIGAAIGFTFLEQILSIWRGYQNVSLTAASAGLFDVDWGGGDIGSFVPGGDLTTWHSVAIILGWSLVGATLVWLGVQRRDA